MLIMESTISGQLLGLLNDPSRFGKNPMDTVADDIIIGWCDLDPKLVTAWQPLLSDCSSGPTTRRRMNGQA